MGKYKTQVFIAEVVHYLAPKAGGPGGQVLAQDGWRRVEAPEHPRG